ncbi:MAG TPA: hypothetical protein VFQ65_26730, partial [Kofleriaceae bacterium]|nr:hypothetical protein [Kofleriaceae bacterium]
MSPTHLANRVEKGCDHLDDATLLARFESLDLAPSDFRHREHIRLAFAMLRDADFGEAALRFRAALERFVASIGAHAKYHETLTWAYLALVSRCTHEGGYSTSFALLDAHPDLLDHQTGLLAQ